LGARSPLGVTQFDIDLMHDDMDGRSRRSSGRARRRVPVLGDERPAMDATSVRR